VPERAEGRAVSGFEPRYRRWRLRHAGAYDSLREVLLANRELTAEDVSNSPEVLHDPLEMAGMAEAVARIDRAVEREETIVVFGDYDVDGVTSTALLLDYLERIGADARAMLPHRFHDGYGLRPAAVERAAELGAGLIVTADNGISSFDAVEAAAAAGIDVVIVDHHLPHDRLPEAAAIVDPKRPDCDYPFEGLAAVGLVFKLVQALTGGRMPTAERRRYLNDLLDLVALGTVADVAPMVGENRLLTSRGIRLLERSRLAARAGRAEGRPGLVALMGVADSMGREIDTMTIGFQLGPRLNSAGRLESAELALDLLRAPDAQSATGLAAKLDELNRRRRELQEEGLEEARQAVLAGDPERDRLLVVKGDAWDLGVIGLIAGRLAEEFGRPAVACTAAKGDGTLVGSARTAAGYDIGQAIFRCEEHLIDFGGHAAAAGLTVAEERFDALRDQLVSEAGERLTEEDLTPELELDLELAPRDLSLASVEELRTLAPFGFGNEAPRFLAGDCRVARVRRIGQDGAHLKLELETGAGRHDAVFFRRGDLAGRLPSGSRVDAAFALEANTWQGRTDVQLRLIDLRPAVG
jgi:single-stranded-DNA-specific exonuclease